ncbi:hypothetical protein [Sphingomonas cavernae]|uniref:Uncharacterized protein n=1 Tax=Sphingomonas cavernae TaxID=2320861 RepID=A0A418WMA4_9SPHN|nr:hypothetical protein [Sphingomonas cavernae]RJF91139.1 hypothetical protein D3876_13485 [Sphingomonas cavernae]
MSSVDPVFAQWLQSEGLWAIQTDAPRAAQWGEQAITAERMTALAFKADAVDEAARQLAFLGGPLAEDEHLLPGRWRHRKGQVVTLTIGRLGYDAGKAVFVLDAQDDLARGLSTVTVLCRL